jgi:phosphoglycerate kinase
MRTIKDVPISGKKVIIRVDFNVPLDEYREITDDSRIKAVLPTIDYALRQNSKLIIASHLGRPKGKIRPEFSLLPAAERLSILLKRDVRLASDCIGPEVSTLVSEMKTGDIVLLENLRFHSDEEKNADAFAKKLAAMCDVYVNDAFAVSHRANASVEAITKYARQSVAGLLLKGELDYFDKAITNPQRPLAAIVGGSKVSSKLNALENMIQRVDKLIIGGAMANTFLKSNGCPVGKSKVEDDLLEAAETILRKSKEKGVLVYLPVDVVAASAFDPEAETRTVPVQEIPSDWMALDIGPASSLLFSESLADAKTIVWNGPMGVFEMDAFSAGTLAMAKSVADSNALTIAGGGDTDAALHNSGKIDKISYISTGGGAFLALLEGKTLPAVAALEEAETGQIGD